MLALVCGTGSLPRKVAAALPDRPLVAAMEGFLPDALDADLTFRLETLGSLLGDLTARGVTEVCFCGAIDRPGFDPARLDAATRTLVPQLQAALVAGDDGALRAVIAMFEAAGMTIRAVHELVPDLVAPAGVLSARTPDAGMRRDAEKGIAILSALAPFDTGQACVVGQGQLLGVETISGTDALLRALPDVPQRAGAVLVKAPKTGQDLRVDMPTVGPETVRAATAAGLGAIVIAASGTLLLDRDETIALCDAAGLVLWAMDG